MYNELPMQNQKINFEVSLKVPKLNSFWIYFISYNPYENMPHIAYNLKILVCKYSCTLSPQNTSTP